MVLVGLDQTCSSHLASLKLHCDRLLVMWRGSGEVWQERVLRTLTRVTSELPPVIHKTTRVNIQLTDFLQGKVVQELERCSMEKSTGCSCRGPRFDSQHPRGSSQPSVTPISRESDNLASAGTRHACGVQANTHTHKVRIN